jgi:hypothetical protein
MTLTGLRSATRTVVFDHASGAISAQSVVDFSDPIDSDPYAVTLKFIEL